MRYISPIDYPPPRAFCGLSSFGTSSCSITYQTSVSFSLVFAFTLPSVGSICLNCSKKNSCFILPLEQATLSLLNDDINSWLFSFLIKYPSSSVSTDKTEDKEQVTIRTINEIDKSFVNDSLFIRTREK